MMVVGYSFALNMLLSENIDSQRDGQIIYECRTMYMSKKAEVRSVDGDAGEEFQALSWLSCRPLVGCQTLTQMEPKCAQY